MGGRHRDVNRLAPVSYNKERWLSVIPFSLVRILGVVATKSLSLHVVGSSITGGLQFPFSLSLFRLL